MSLAAILKAPGEALYIVPRWRPGFVPVEIGAVDVTPRGLVTWHSGTALGAHGDWSGDQPALWLSAGADGEQYLIRATGIDADGAQAQAEVEVSVIEPGWAMPDGGAPYLSILELAQRVGFAELVRMTDADGSGRIDRDYLIAALIDAQAEIDANLAARFVLPLDPVPPIVKRWMADLARGRLYPAGAPEGVEQAARAATRMLERAAEGKLPLPAGDALAAEGPGDAPVLIAPGRRAYPDGLKDFG